MAASVLFRAVQHSIRYFSSSWCLKVKLKLPRETVDDCSHRPLSFFIRHVACRASDSTEHVLVLGKLFQPNEMEKSICYTLCCLKSHSIRYSISCCVFTTPKLSSFTHSPLSSRKWSKSLRFLVLKRERERENGLEKKLSLHFVQT